MTPEQEIKGRNARTTEVLQNGETKDREATHIEDRD